MRATLLLADFAQVAEGKLNIIGGGWTVIGPQPAPSAIALLVEVPWDQANRQHRMRLELVDADGAPAVVTGPDDSEHPILFESSFEVGRPAGLKPGTPLGVPLAINFGPHPLEPGRRYEWRLSINDETDEDWRLAFEVRPFAE